MPTNYERREVARRLRKIADSEKATKMDVKNTIGLYQGCYTKRYSPESVKRLADLIEPEPERACKPNVWCDGIVKCHGVYERWLAECGSCGAILSEASSEERARICLPNYCPNCGTRVIKHAD